MKIRLHIERVMVDPGVALDLSALEQAIGAALANRRVTSVPRDGTAIEHLRGDASERVAGSVTATAAVGAQLGGLVHRHLFAGGSHGRS